MSSCLGECLFCPYSIDNDCTYNPDGDGYLYYWSDSEYEDDKYEDDE